MGKRFSFLTCESLITAYLNQTNPTQPNSTHRFVLQILRNWSFFMHPDGSCTCHIVTLSSLQLLQQDSTQAEVPTSTSAKLCEQWWKMTGISKMYFMWLCFPSLITNASRSGSRAACHSTICQTVWKGTELSSFLSWGFSFLNCVKEWWGYRAVSPSFPSFGLHWLSFILKMLQGAQNIHCCYKDWKQEGFLKSCVMGLLTSFFIHHTYIFHPQP